MNIVLLGNCQIESIKASLNVLLPTANVAMLHSWNLKREFETVSALNKHLAHADVVIAHRFYDVPNIGFDEISDHPRFLEFPVLNFSCFHPDCIYLTDGDTKKMVRSVIGDYNSALVGYSYQNSVSIDNCISSFQDEIFRFVGYYDLWDSSVRALDAEFARCGFSAGDFLASWMSKKTFVHSINHPKIFAIHDIVKASLGKLRINHLGIGDIEDFIADPLLSYAGWPVYEPIGQVYGYPGNFYFRGDRLANNVQHLFTLSEFVEKSYEKYETMGVRYFSNGLFDVWDQLGLLDRIDK